MLAEPTRDDSHLLALFKEDGCWGAVAKSNFVGLRFREPIHRTLRELVVSYFEDFYNDAREKTLRGYTRPLSLRPFDRLGWETNDEPLDAIADRLDAIGRVSLLTPARWRGSRRSTSGRTRPGCWGSIGRGCTGCRPRSEGRAVCTGRDIDARQFAVTLPAPPDHSVKPRPPKPRQRTGCRGGPQLRTEEPRGADRPRNPRARSVYAACLSIIMTASVATSRRRGDRRSGRCAISERANFAVSASRDVAGITGPAGAGPASAEPEWPPRAGGTLDATRLREPGRLRGRCRRLVAPLRRGLRRPARPPRQHRQAAEALEVHPADRRLL